MSKGRWSLRPTEIERIYWSRTLSRVAPNGNGGKPITAEQRDTAYAMATAIWERYQRMRKAARGSASTIHADAVAAAKAEPGFVAHARVGQREAVLTRNGTTYWARVWKSMRATRPSMFSTTMRTADDLREYLGEL